MNNFQFLIKNYKKLSEKNLSIACYICDTDFSSNNKFHQHFMNCVKITQSKQAALNMNNLQVIEFTVTNKTIFENYIFKN